MGTSTYYVTRIFNFLEPPSTLVTKNRTNPYVLIMVRNKSLTPPLERYVFCGRPLYEYWNIGNIVLSKTVFFFYIRGLKFYIYESSWINYRWKNTKRNKIRMMEKSHRENRTQTLSSLTVISNFLAKFLIFLHPQTLMHLLIGARW
jgi:hypothetical protein